MEDRKKFWEHVYQRKSPQEVSWTQKVPETSLTFIRRCELPHSAPIIDVGGGDSTLVDHLLTEGYNNITVLDISEKAIEKAKDRLGKRASQVQWITSDILDFTPPERYQLWHDRATFHFLNKEEEIARYIQIASKNINGYLILATFSETGPEKCTGLPVHRYSESSLEAILSSGFIKLACIQEDHITPSHSRQNFLFCSFGRIKRI